MAARTYAPFAKLPQIFGFSVEYTDSAMNLKSFFPDFVATDKAGTHWLLEAKGQENKPFGRVSKAATLPLA
jgi:hypothetical protein